MTKHDDLKARVEQVLIEEVGPLLQMDGGRIEVVAVAGGVAQLRLNGVCGGCPSTIMVLLTGLEKELCRRVPEIAFVEALP